MLKILKYWRKSSKSSSGGCVELSEVIVTPDNG